MRKLIVLFGFIGSLCSARHERPIVIVSVHKCGTHLVGEAIAEMTGKKIFWPGYIRGDELDETLENLGDDRFMMIHVPYRQDVVEIMQRHNAIIFFVYRDPRDYVVSFAYFRLHWLGADGKPNMNLSAIITELIESFVAPWYADSTTTRGAISVFDAMLGWRAYPDVCIVRFEDLVGPQGGGSAPVQKETIRRIAHHLELAVNEDRVSYVADTIFGNGVTFREGKIGSWKSHFTERDVQLCKENVGQLLIDLGYEANLDWTIPHH